MKFNELKLESYDILLSEAWGDFGEKIKQWPWIEEFFTKNRTKYGQMWNFIGRNSDVIDVAKKGPAIREMKSEKGGIIALLIFGDGLPAAIAHVQYFGTYGKRTDIVVNRNEAVVPRGKKGETMSRYNRRTGYTWKGEHAYDFYSGSSGKQINTVIKALEDAGMKVTFKAIIVDPDRIDLKNKRSKSKAGVVPLPDQKGYDKFIREIRGSLNQKLETFKAQRAPKVSNVDEMLSLIRSSGYLNKINVGGDVFELYRDDLRIRDLERGEGKIVYQMDYKGRMKKFELDSGKNAAPEYIMISMGWDGANIVPTNIQATNQYY